MRGGGGRYDGAGPRMRVAMSAVVLMLGCNSYGTPDDCASAGGRCVIAGGLGVCAKEGPQTRATAIQVVTLAVPSAASRSSTRVTHIRPATDPQLTGGLASQPLPSSDASRCAAPRRTSQCTHERLFDPAYHRRWLHRHPRCGLRRRQRRPQRVLQLVFMFRNGHSRSIVRGRA